MPLIGCVLVGGMTLAAPGPQGSFVARGQRPVIGMSVIKRPRYGCQRAPSREIVPASLHQGAVAGTESHVRLVSKILFSWVGGVFRLTAVSHPSSDDHDQARTSKRGFTVSSR